VAPTPASQSLSSVSLGEITVLRTFFQKKTAGKDRTGVVAGMLQALAGSPADAVLFDYMLSRIGFEPIREQLLFTAMMDTGPAVMATPGFFNMNSIRPTYWMAFQALVDERFGGWDGYVTGELGFSAEDLETIKRHLRGE
jgi:protein tyrosine/serine phosphatase